MPSLALDTLIFFVTSRCNSKCRTCFWAGGATKDDLSFAEIERLSATMPRFREIWLSGRSGRSERSWWTRWPSSIARTVCARSTSRPNGLLPRKLLGVVEEGYLSDLPGNEDQPQPRPRRDRRDPLRGCPGNFQRRPPEPRGAPGAPPPRVPPAAPRHTWCWGRERPHGDGAPGRDDEGTLHLDRHYFQVIRGEPMDPGLRRSTRSCSRSFLTRGCSRSTVTTRTRSASGAGGWGRPATWAS